MKHKLIVHLLIGFLLISCKGGDSNTENSAPESKATFEVLLMGNSHSSYNNLPGMLATLIKTGTNESVSTANAPGWAFLDERLSDGVSEQFLLSRKWTHVILQAQKYSTSGLYSYSTEPSKEWIRKVKKQNAVPIMFPEWPRRGNFEEGVRIHSLHESIVAAEPACLAPIGLTWDQVILSHPSLTLHNPDGNHSNKNGALLTAYVLYEVITKQQAVELPVIDSLGIAASIQTTLKAAVSEVVEANPPCTYFQ
ncbi:MAG: hypothetical protein HWE16_03325 [Gammaproteobacteria bacterium]|nr:hypothetical protein [Gammaproteobacteria bacterium]